MRLITVHSPAGEGQKLVALAFQHQIKEVFVGTAEVYRPGEAVSVQDVVNIQTATPKAKKLIESLTAAPFYNPKTFSFTIRHPESLFGSDYQRKKSSPSFDRPPKCTRSSISSSNQPSVFF